MIKTVEWTKDGIRMLDQRLLPSEETYLMLRSYDEVAEAIRKMVVRGAPAIGVSAAMGIALGASQSVGTSVADLEDDPLEEGECIARLLSHFPDLLPFFLSFQCLL